jgi:hypothetical protein
MNAQLTEMSEQLRANSKRAEDIVAKAGIDRIAVRPRENAWSIAECLVHLTLGTMSYFPLWPDSLRQAGPQQGRYRMDFIGRMLAWVFEPPARFRAKSPANFMPVDIGSPDDVLPRFLLSQESLLAVVAGADGLAIDRIKIVSPAASRVRYSVWSSFCITAAHERRHLWQAERVLLKP